MSRRARPRRGEWRPPRPRGEVYRAVAAAVVILGGTAGIIYLWPTGSSSTNTPVTVTTSKPKSTTTTKPAPTTPTLGTQPPPTSAPASTTTAPR